MHAIGLDIGTTTICAVVVNGSTGRIIDTITENNQSLIQGEFEWEKLQNPDVILSKATGIVRELTGKYSPVGCIGVTGQMHGIIYTDGKGNAVSPLYSWQDGRGDLKYAEGLSYAEFLSKKTRYKLATGFGAVTHFYNLSKGLVPPSARHICTIQDYIGMKLAKCDIPLMNSSNAASLGLFNIESNSFDSRAIQTCGMDESLFPRVSSGAGILGMSAGNIPVTIAVGDNQASFMGSVKDRDRSILLNVGTGSQISVFTNQQIQCSGAETRPFPDGGFLLVGAPLCGGSAYAVLDKFFRSVVNMATGKESSSLYNIMDRYAAEVLDDSNKLEISTSFKGTRDNPSLRGSIRNIGTDNFTPQHLALGIIEGIANELYNLYKCINSALEKKPDMIVGSGNGIRKNMILQKIVTRLFNMPLQIPAYKEEAAYGAALLSMVGVGHYKDISEAQSFIRYRGDGL